MKALCRCGHDVHSHGLFGCDVCGCSRDTMLSDRLIASDRIRKQMTQLAAAEADSKLQPVVIHNDERRTA